MTAEEWFYGQLAADDTLNSLVGGRIYPTMPVIDSPLPYLYYSRAETETFWTLTGPTTLKRVSMAADVWATTLAECCQITDAVADAVNGKRDGVVQGCFLDDQTSEQDDLGYHVAVAYTVFGTF